MGATVEEHLNGAHELHLDAGVLQPLAIFRTDGDCALDSLAIEVERAFLSPGFVELDVYRRSLIGVLQDNVNVQGRREGEQGHDGINRVGVALADVNTALESRFGAT